MNARGDSPGKSKKWSSWKAHLVRLVTYPLVFYVGVMIAMLVCQEELMFVASGTRDIWVDPPQGIPIEEVEFVTQDGLRIQGWWAPCDQSDEVVLLCHGQATNISMCGGVIACMREELGASVLVFDYPGYGRSEGRPTEAGCYAGADAAYDWLVSTQRVPPERLLIFGDSLGTGVAVDLASRRPHQALILHSPYTSVPDAAQALFPIFPTRWLTRYEFDSRSKIASCHSPVFIAHGTHDRTIPYRQGAELFASANEPKHFLTMEGLGHCDPIPSEFFTILRRIVAETSTDRQSETTALAE